MAAGSDWFSKMSEAVRTREHALNGVARWEEKVQAAEAVINALTAERDKAEVAPTAADLAVETSVSMPQELRAVFGAGAGPAEIIYNQQ